jgi:hypothetical protein
MKLFVYGKLKSNQSKAWMIPFSKNRPYTLYNFKMFLRPEGTAGMKRGQPDDFVTGEIREVRWAIWPLNKLLLWFLDLNEGTFRNIYKRILIRQRQQPFHNDYLWAYLFERSTKRYYIIRKWDKGDG